MITTTPNRYLLLELDKYRRETNTIFYSLSRNLITLAVLSLTISPVFITTKIDNVSEKYIYIWSMAAALISVFAGIAQYYRDWRGFGEYTHYLTVITHTSQKERNERQRKIVDKFIEKNKGNKTFNTGEAWLILQLLSMLISLTLLLAVITMVTLRNT